MAVVGEVEMMIGPGDGVLGVGNERVNTAEMRQRAGLTRVDSDGTTSSDLGPTIMTSAAPCSATGWLRLASLPGPRFA
jgi:hypothetical protein